MKHEEIKLKLFEFYDGESGPQLPADLQAHLSGCADCAQDLAAWRELASPARSLRTPVPSDFTARVMRDVRQEEAENAEKWTWRDWVAFPKWKAAAALGMVALSLVYSISASRATESSVTAESVLLSFADGGAFNEDSATQTQTDGPEDVAKWVIGDDL